MKNRSQITLICAFFFLSTPTLAKTTDSSIQLECTYKNTLDLRSTILTETVGSKHVSVQLGSKQSVILKVEGKGSDFSGSMSESEISTETMYLLGNHNVRETFKINRYTGAFENLFQFNNSSGLLHTGVCSSINKKF